MSKNSILVFALVVGSAIALCPVSASGQTSDPVIHACYIPAVGVVYRIKAPGLPSGCLGKSHVEFEWNIKGDPGNLGLAGQSCPAGSFITGFSATGAFVCGQSLPPSDPVVMFGQWGDNIGAIPLGTCTGIDSQTGQSAQFSWGAARGFFVQAGTPGNITLGFGVQIGDGIGTLLATGTLPQPLSFPFTVSVHNEVSFSEVHFPPFKVPGGRVTMNGTMTFTSAARAHGELQATAFANYDGTPATCAPIPINADYVKF